MLIAARKGLSMTEESAENAKPIESVEEAMATGEAVEVQATQEVAGSVEAAGGRAVSDGVPDAGQGFGGRASSATSSPVGVARLAAAALEEGADKNADDGLANNDVCVQAAPKTLAEAYALCKVDADIQIPFIPRPPSPLNIKILNWGGGSGARI